MNLCTFIDPNFLEGIKVIRQFGGGFYGAVFLVQAADNNHYVIKYISAFTRGLDVDEFRIALWDTDNSVRFRGATDDIINLLGICYKPVNVGLVIEPINIGLVMEPMDYDLRQLIGMISLEQRLSIVPGLLLSMARALSIFEMIGIVHFDVKTSNILVKGGDQPRYKLADFGTSRPDLKNIHPLRIFRYTEGYKPPEELFQVQEVLINHHREDIWALAISIIKVINVNPTFSTVSHKNIYYLTDYRNTMKLPSFVEKIRRMEVSGGLDMKRILLGQYEMIENHLGSPIMTILSKMLSLNPNDRPSAQQIVQAFGQTIDPEYVRRFIPPVFPRKIDRNSIRLIFQLVYDLIDKSYRISVIIIATEILTRYLHQVDSASDHLLSTAVIFLLAAIYIGEAIYLSDIIKAIGTNISDSQFRKMIKTVLTIIRFQIYNTNLTSYINSIDENKFNFDDFFQSIPQWTI